jgi:hypothetical protein
MRWRILGLAAVLLLSVGTGQAAAATTFGADLDTPPDGSLSDVTAYTSVARSIPLDQQAAGGGATAPVDGVVVRWRIRSAANSRPSGMVGSWEARFRLARGDHAVGASAAVLVADIDDVQTFNTRLPIQEGDALGLDTPGGEGKFLITGEPNAILDLYNPPLGADETRGPPDGSPGYVLDVNADIEPDADGDGFGDETQDLCPTDVTRHIACPAPQTTITKHPKAKSRQKHVTFEFSSDQPGATFECSLDGEGLAACLSPRVIKVGKGKHVFQVIATNPKTALTDATPASYSFKVKKKHKKHHGHHGSHH